MGPLGPRWVASVVQIQAELPRPQSLRGRAAVVPKTDTGAKMAYVGASDARRVKPTRGTAWRR